MTDIEIVGKNTICPVIGEPILKPEEWQNVDLGEGYSASFFRIGNNIFGSLPCGNSGKNGMVRFLQAREAFLENQGMWNAPHFELKNFGKIIGNTTQNARKQFTRHMLMERERGALKGFIGYNAPLFIKWVMNVGNKMYVHSFPVKVVDDYQIAVKEAVRVMNQYIEPEVIHKSSKNGWYVTLGKLSIEYKKLSEDTLYAKYEGMLEEKNIQNFFEFNCICKL